MDISFGDSKPAWTVMGASLNRFGAILWCSIAVLETVVGVFEASWAVVSPLGTVLGASWERLGPSRDPLSMS